MNMTVTFPAQIIKTRQSYFSTINKRLRTYDHTLTRKRTLSGKYLAQFILTRKDFFICDLHQLFNHYKMHINAFTRWEDIYFDESYSIHH